MKLEKHFFEYFSNSTIHAVPNIVREKNIIIKLMWITFFLLSSGLCAYLILESIFSYLEYKVSTVLRRKNEFKALFPTVTICSPNFFTTDYALEYYKNSTEISGLKDFSDLDQIFKVFILANFNDGKISLDEIKKFSYTKEDIILSCTFLSANCSAKSLKYVFNKQFGNCFRFNSGLDDQGNKVPLLSTTRTVKEGLELLLFVGLPDRLKLFEHGTGVYVFVHNHSTYSFEPYYNIVPVNTKAEIKLTRNFFKQMPNPYSNCVLESNMRNSILYQMTKNATNYYTQSDCLLFCIQRLSCEMCNCSSPSWEKYQASRECKSKEDFECITKVYEKFVSKNYIQDNCISECPLECETTDIIRTISTNYLITNEFQEKKLLKNEKIKKLYSKENFSTSLKENVVKVRVFYETLAYTELEEYASMDLIALWSNIGGLAGLFLGISVLSFVEIFEVLIKALCLFFENSKFYFFNNKNRTRKIESNLT